MAGHGADEHPHGADRLCAAGDRVYSRAVRRGRGAPPGRRAGPPASWNWPCCTPTPTTWTGWCATSPQEVMTRLLRGVHDEVNASHGGWAPRWRPSSGTRVSAASSRPRPARRARRSASWTVWAASRPRWTRRRRRARRRCSPSSPAASGVSMSCRRAAPGAGAARARGTDAGPVHARGPARAGPAQLPELMGDAVEARTLDEVIDHLILFDRTVAFIPANTDRTMALELRHPALIAYLVTVFERLWRLAHPPDRPLPDTGIEGHLPPRAVHRGAAGGGPPGRGDRGTPGHKRPHGAGPHRPPLGDPGRGQPHAAGVRIAQAGLDGSPRLPAAISVPDQAPGRGSPTGR